MANCLLIYFSLLYVFFRSITTFFLCFFYFVQNQQKDITFNMNNNIKQNWKIYLSGLICGIINGLLGAGGGMIIVPVLINNGIKVRKAHATSVSIVLFLTILSTFIYVVNGKVSIIDAVPFLPFGIIGSIVGSKILQKINSDFLKKLFAILMVWAGIKMLT